MGRQDATKPKGGKTTSSQLPVKLLFSPKPSPPATASSQENQVEMAAAAERQAAQLTKQDWDSSFHAFETDFVGRMNALLNPIIERLEDLGDRVGKVEQTAESAIEMALVSQQDIQHLQESEKWMLERITSLETRLRSRNLKLRGIAEGEEGTSDLALFVSHWLAQALTLDDGIAPVLNRAHRLGPANHPTFKGPRDILIELADDRTRSKILREAREKGHLAYKNSPVLVLPDLPPEILQKRRQLKDVTVTLQEAKIKYRWSPSSDLIVHHQGTTYKASDPSSGQRLLLALGLLSTPDDSKKSIKRKLVLNMTPPKLHKIPAKEV